MATRFEDISIRAFIDDQEVAVLTATDVSMETQVRHESVKYQGEKIPRKDSTEDGHTFSVTTEIDAANGDVDELMDRFLAAVRSRDGSGRVRVVIAYRLAGTQVSRAYRYNNCQLNVSSRAGTNGKLVKVLRGEAESRDPIQ